MYSKPGIMPQKKKIKLQPPPPPPSPSPKGQFTTVRDYDEDKAKQLLTNLIPQVQDISGHSAYAPDATKDGIAELKHILDCYRLSNNLKETIDGHSINRPDKEKIQVITGLSVLHTIATRLDVKTNLSQIYIGTGTNMRETGENIKKALLSHYNDQMARD